MKKTLLVVAFVILTGALGLRGYFVLTPPPSATLNGQLSEIFPSKLAGWQIRDMEMSSSPEASARVSEFLNFDDSLFRVFERGDTTVGLYIAYWTPGKASYRWAGAHTPDTCWVVNGWTRLEREYSVEFSNGETPFEPVEFGIYEKDGTVQNVYFWHIVGGNAYGYEQKEIPNIFGALIDIQKHGLNLREEQFFIRLSSNKKINELKATPGFKQILDALGKVCLAPDAEPIDV